MLMGETQQELASSSLSLSSPSAQAVFTHLS